MSNLLDRLLDRLAELKQVRADQWKILNEATKILTEENNKYVDIQTNIWAIENAIAVESNKDIKLEFEYDTENR